MRSPRDGGHSGRTGEGTRGPLFTGDIGTEYPINGWTIEGPIDRIASAAGEGWIAAIGLASEADFLARFDGTAFQKVDLPSGLQLEAVGTGTAGTWIAGYSGPDETRGLFRRTGGTWTPVDLPDGMTGIRDLAAAPDGSGMWAVGGGSSAPLAVARFDGTSWKSLPTPPGLGSFGRVVPVTEDEVWATTAWVAVHWDGTDWTAAPFPDEYPHGFLEDLAVDASGTVWATDGGETLHRYKDGEWTAVNFGSYGTFLNAITAVPGTNTMWLVGEGTDALAYTTP
ncbi:hypothetical protein AB0L25_26130 [Spirillospora sp. NPDC052242]